jgi:pimeloyl-ACP methyl ester carboxylesterase
MGEDSTGLVRWAVRAGLVAGTAMATTAARRRHVARKAAGRAAELLSELVEVADAVPLGSVHSEPITVYADDGVGLCVEIEEAPRQPNAPTLVFLPGFCLNMDTWHFQRQDLRGVVRCVFYDQRGHGRSGRGDPERSTMAQLISDLRAVIAATAPDGPVVLVGHSLGGMVVMSYAAGAPEDFGDRIMGAALVATSSGRLADMTLGLPPAVVKSLWRFSPGVVDLVTNRPLLIARGMGADRDIGLWVTRRLSFGRTDVDPAVARFAGEILNSTPLDVFGEFFAEFTRFDQEAALPTLRTVQTLIVGGGKDVLTPLAASRRMAAAVPEAELTVLPDAGHLVMLEYPDEVNAALRRLIERVRVATYRDSYGEAAV